MLFSLVTAAPLDLSRCCYCHTNSIFTSSCGKYSMNCLYIFFVDVTHSQTQYFELLLVADVFLSLIFRWVVCFCHLRQHIFDLLLYYYHAADLFRNGFFSSFTSTNWNFSILKFPLLCSRSQPPRMQLIIFGNIVATRIDPFLAYSLCVYRAKYVKRDTVNAFVNYMMSLGSRIRISIVEY